MSTHEHDRHNRADAPRGALSPGSTADGEPGGPHPGLVGVPPRVRRSPADPEALVRGQRVTNPHDMERESQDGEPQSTHTIEEEQ